MLHFRKRSGTRQRSARLVLTSLLLACTAYAQPQPPTRVSVTLSPDAPHLHGAIDLTFRNTSHAPLTEVYWFLFPNRFAEPDAGVNDFNRPFIYPYQEFEAGGMTVSQARLEGQTLKVRPLSAQGVPDGCVVAVELPTPLPPGAAVNLSLDFATTLPIRFGTFGIFEKGITALGGWYPYPVDLRNDGTWGLGEPPALRSFDVTASWSEPLQVMLNGFPLTNGAQQHVEAVHFLTLVAAPDLLRDEVYGGSTSVVYLHRPPRRADRKAFGPSQDEIMRETLQSIATHLPAPLAFLPEQIVIVEAPLRLNLTADGQGMVVISDRSLKANWLLRPFHEAQLAQAVYAEALRPLVARREAAADYFWINEGVSHALAKEYLQSERPPTRSVESWIELFNIFAIVDRFESEPKVPFVSAFFERERSADTLHDQITSFNREVPPGRVILGKLEHELAREEFGTVLRRCLRAPLPFLDCAETVAHRPLRARAAQWLQPYPQINYEIASQQLRQPRDGRYANEVVVRRRASRPIQEPVEVELRSIGGEPVRVRWDGNGDEGRVEAITDERMYRAVIDPDRKLIEDTRADNASPPIPQVVLDSAEVEVSSTEFGFSGLAVARARYDYTKDIAAAGFFTNRGVGATIGPRYHWGTQNDSTLYRHNLYAFYIVNALDRGFKDDRIPSVRTSGHTNGVGLRYNYNNIFAYDNPTRSIDFRLFGDWFDQSLGSDYNYATWGTSIVGTHPLGTARTILAAELTNGFSEPLGSSRVPNQGLYSLGGSRSIRGIGAEDQLGRNIFLIRSELRQTIYPELDLNLLDLLVLRRTQARAFVDTGSVSNSAGSIYNPQNYAVGAGVGLAIVYDFMGFFPSVAYVEVATRLDQGQENVQFLFGTRQAF